MTNHRTKLKTLLRKLFQFDAADLDFGIYRIMNQRRAEIDDFVEKGLLDAVAQGFTLLQEGIAEEKHEELGRVAHKIREAYPGAIDEQGALTLPEQFMQADLPMTYVRLQTEVKRATVSAEAEADIFNAIYTFFSRYYDRGRLRDQSPLLPHSQVRYSLQRRGSAAALGQPRPVLRQDR